MLGDQSVYVSKYVVLVRNYQIEREVGSSFVLQQWHWLEKKQ